MCDQWQLVRYAANQLSARERRALEQHLTVCTNCSALLREWQRVANAVKVTASRRVAALPPLRVLDTLQPDRVRAPAQAVGHRRGRERSGAWLTRPMLAGLAAGLTVIALVIAILILTGRQSWAPAMLQATTVTPTAAPIPRPIPLNSYRGTIWLRFKLVLVTDDNRTPSEDWQIYVWHDQAGKTRYELYQTCKDQPVPSHEPLGDSNLRRVGARADFTGPTFERCEKPIAIAIQDQAGLLAVNLRDATPAVYYDQVPRDSGYFDPGGMLASPFQANPTDMSWGYLYRALSTMGYSNVGHMAEEQVAGRQATVMKMDAKVPDKPAPGPGVVVEASRLLWLDAETNLVLASESLDKEGITILSWAFTDFESEPTFEPDLFTYMPYPQTKVNFSGLDERWKAIARQVSYPVFMPGSSGRGGDIIARLLMPQRPTLNDGVVEQDFIFRSPGYPNPPEASLRIVQGAAVDLPADALDMPVGGAQQAHFYQLPGAKGAYINRLVVVKGGRPILLETSGEVGPGASDLIPIAEALQPVEE